jgi:hypothetical protein
VSADLEKRFSLQWLPSGVNTSQSGNNPPTPVTPPGLQVDALNQAISVYTGPVLSVLSSIKDGIRVFDLYDSIVKLVPSLPLDMATLQILIKWMVKHGLIRIVSPDNHGNDLIALGKD